MNKLTKITQGISKFAGRKGLVIKKYSPEILLTVGIGGVIVSTVMACKATTKAEDILDEHKDIIDKINIVNDEHGDTETYEITDYRKDLTVTYVQTGVKFVKLYGPSVTLGIVSIGCILGSHGIMKKRNVAIAAAYKAIETSFDNYRKRVIEEFGESKDYNFKHGIYSEEVTETITDEDGKKKKVKKTVQTVNPENGSEYARYFSKETSKRWDESAEYNKSFLINAQNYANDMLRVRGHVFLNEIYDSLGFERSEAGAIVGWVKDMGDGFIDFNLFDPDGNIRFINGLDNSILLDFNVSGVIYDLI